MAKKYNSEEMRLLSEWCSNFTNYNKTYEQLEFNYLLQLTCHICIYNMTISVGQLIL